MTLMAEERALLRDRAMHGDAWKMPRLSEQIVALLADLEAAQAENERLRLALQKYGLHLYSECLDKRKRCICGLGNLLRERQLGDGLGPARRKLWRGSFLP